MRRGSRGWTIVELAVAVTLGALLVATVVGLIRQPHLRVHRARQVALAVEFDASARRVARRRRERCILRYDLDRSEIACISAGGDRHLLSPLQLLYGVRIGRVWGEGGRVYRTGRVSWVVDRWGVTRSYGVELIRPGGRSEFVLYSGASGKVEHLSGPREVRRVLRALASIGDDID